MKSGLPSPSNTGLMIGSTMTLPSASSCVGNTAVGSGFLTSNSAPKSMKIDGRSPSSCAPEPSGISSSARSEEHTYELQSLMRTSYAVFCLKKKQNDIQQLQTNNNTI